MITLAQLTGADRATYREILAQPVSSDLRRPAVRALLETLGHIATTTPDRLQVTRNGHVLMLPSSRTKKIESKTTVVALRRFLKRSEVPVVPSNGREAHLLLVIGLHEIRLFRADVYGGTIEQLLPRDGNAAFTIAEPDGVSRKLAARGPDFGGIFAPIAKALPATGQLLIFGESSATHLKMDRFVSWLKTTHPHAAARIVGSEVLHQDRIKSEQLLAKARHFYTESSRGIRHQSSPTQPRRPNRQSS